METDHAQCPKIETTYNLLVVDDHRFIHDVISKIIGMVGEMTVIGHAANGLEAVRTIHAKYPDIKILVLSSFQDHESVHLTLKNGALGYVTKSALTAELISSIRTILSGKNVFSPEVVERMVFSAQSPQAISKLNLTDREIEVLVLLAEGLQNQQVAERLEISGSTVKYHKNNIFKKLGVQTQSEALVIVVKNNLI